MKGACEFFLDFLTEEPEHGWLVCVPSISPENTPAKAGIHHAVVSGATMDNQMVFDLFSNTIAAAESPRLRCGSCRRASGKAFPARSHAGG